MRQADEYVLVIEHMADGVIAAVQYLRSEPAWHGLGIVLLTERPRQLNRFTDAPVPIRTAMCDFDRPETIAVALEPFRDGIRGVVCRGDVYIQQLRATLPFLPRRVPAPSRQALRAATDKRLMRRAFQRRYPEITPRFVEVQDASPATLAKVAVAQLNYPVIVKPANLASSLLVQSCGSAAELKQSLTMMFDRIHEIYQREKRRQKPQAIVEEYLEGEFYSIDAYVSEVGVVRCCPPVCYVPAKQLGIDDFFLYKRTIPAGLSAAETTTANDVVAKAIAAVGLAHSSAHVELVRTAAGWKVIELGPRLGNFRHKMYGLSYGIDHSLNDVKLHLGLPVEIPENFKLYSATYSIYPEREGRLRTIRGLDDLARRPEIVWLSVRAQTGNMCLQAKHGGHALAQFMLATPDRRRFAAVCQAAEEVHADCIKLNKML